MNEKIKQFGEQAIHYAASRPMSELKDRDLYLDNLFEKFAELIVRECAEQSMSIGRYNTPSGVTPDLAIAISVGLKKHFGVEE